MDDCIVNVTGGELPPEEIEAYKAHALKHDRVKHGVVR